MEYSMSQKMINVLVVDDEKEILECFKDIFKNSNFSIFTANNGKMAIEELKKNNCDIAFIDICMPGMDGVETLKELKVINPNLKAIMISGFRNEDILEKALKIGAFSYLFKPLDIQNIIGIAVKCAKNLGIDDHIEIIH